MATITQRTRSNGNVTYQAKIRMKGYPPQSATFDRKTDARKWVQDTESAMRAGRYFKSSEARKRTVAEMIERYERDVLPYKTTKLKQQQTQKRQLDEWRERLGHHLVADVTPSLLAETRDAMLRVPVGNTNKTRSPATVNRYLAVLSHVFTVAVNEWGWLDDNPMRKVKKPSEPRGRVRFLSDAEQDKLLAVCRDSSCSYLYPVVVLALSTGMRRGEVLGLRWEDVDFKRGMIVLHETKNGERRSVPIVNHAAEELQKLAKVRRIDTNLVFPAGLRGNKDKPFELKKAWAVAVKQAELEDFRFHDLRHTAASRLAMNGASLAEIAEILGHKTLQMVQRYAHFCQSHTSKVVASMNEKMFGGA
jgi:integrase